MNRSCLVLLLVPGMFAGCAVATGGACQTDAECLDGAKCAEGVCTGGEKPTAAFVAPASAAIEATVTLDGSGSTTAGGSADGLLFKWSVVEPTGIELTNPTSAKASFVAKTAHATYKVQLVVTDRGTPSAAVTHDVKVDNSKPAAKLVADAAQFPRNATVTLDASGSTDADADPLAYTWTVVKDPPDAPGTLTPGAGGKASLTTGAVAASYSVTVVVTDGSLSDTASLTGSIANQPPTIAAGDPQTVDHQCGPDGNSRACTASGSLSGAVTDGDGTVAAGSIAWKLKSAPPASHATATFTPSGDDGAKSAFRLVTATTDPIAGEYEFELSAKDNDGALGTGIVKITVGNHAPAIALTGASPRVVEHTYVATAGEFLVSVPVAPTVTDADGDDVTVDFQPLAVTLAGARSEVAAHGDGTATYTLHVSKDHPASLLSRTTVLYSVTAVASEVNGGSATATQPLVVNNHAPEFPAVRMLLLLPMHTYGWLPGVAGGPFYFRTLSFEFDPSDADGDPLTATWAVDGQQALVGGTLNAPEITPYATTPAIVTTALTARGTVSDPFVEGGTGTVGLFLGNRAPTITTATAGPAIVYSGGAAIASCAACGMRGCVVPATSTQFAGGGGAYLPKLDATPSDPDGDPVSVSWSLAAGAHNLFLRKFTAAVPSADCSSDVACPSLTSFGLGAQLIGATECGIKPLLQNASFVETDKLIATPTDAVGLAGTPTTAMSVQIAAGVCPTCPPGTIP